MFVKILLLLVLAVAAHSNEGVSNSSFGDELTLNSLEAINFDMQQSNFRSQEYYQALSSDIACLRRTVEAIETIVTKQVRHIGTLEGNLERIANSVKLEDKIPHIQQELELLATNVSRLLTDSSRIYRIQQTIPTTELLNNFILHLLAGERLKGTKASHPLLLEPKSLPQTCAEVPDRRSGLYRIQPQTGSAADAFEVYCDQEYEGGGWTVIQNRFNGSVNFTRAWNDYEAGFGDLRGEFWLGLRKMHELTSVKTHELHVLLEDFDGKQVVAKYDQFLIGGAQEMFSLSSLGTYHGDAGDALTEVHLGMKFSTFDSDNDGSHIHCAMERKGGWWFNSCSESHLNGLYLKGEQSRAIYGQMMCWYKFRGDTYGLKRSRMMIRAVDRN